jgi:hypothetical protein
MSPLPKPREMLPRPRFRDAHPHLYGGLIGSLLTIPAAAVYSHFRKPINRFICNVGRGIINIPNYAKRMTQNALSAMWNTPFKDKAQSSDTNASKTPTPNPTPRVSSGNEEYDRNHKNTINEKH